MAKKESSPGLAQKIENILSAFIDARIDEKFKELKALLLVPKNGGVTPNSKIESKIYLEKGYDLSILYEYLTRERRILTVSYEEFSLHITGDEFATCRLKSRKIKELTNIFFHLEKARIIPEERKLAQLLQTHFEDMGGNELSLRTLNTYLSDFKYYEQRYPTSKLIKLLQSKKLMSD